MLCLVTGLHCDPGGQTTKLDRLRPKPQKQQGGKKTKKEKKKEWQTVAVFKTRSMWGGGSTEESVAPTPHHLGP